MRKLHNFILALLAISSFTSCEHEWEDELYDQSVSFAKNGITDIRVRYNEDGKVTYRLPVMVSGSLQNTKDMAVNIAIDPDTLADANVRRFSSRTDLYFLPLQEKFYEIPSTANIKAGESEGLLDINFNLTGIDMTRNYILPLTIAEGNGYKPNYRKHFRKALLNVIPYNDYSGTYSATNASIDDGTGKPMTVGTRLTQVIDANKIFFYAGLTQEELINRKDYMVIAEFIPQSAENRDEGTVRFSAPNPDIELEAPDGTYLVTRMMDEVTPYLEHIYVTINMEYKYNDIIDSENKILYTVKGSMIMERKRNILVPDEDQAWQW
jgi:hypothetical protein